MLKLDRETLRDLAPSLEDVAAVRGGDTSMCGTKDYCTPPMAEAILGMLGQTNMSWGCKGRITVRQSDEAMEIDIDLGPSESFLENRPTFRDWQPRRPDPLG